MKSRRHCENIEAYHDGALGPEETLETAGNIAFCRECRETLA